MFGLLRRWLGGTPAAPQSALRPAARAVGGVVADWVDEALAAGACQDAVEMLTLGLMVRGLAPRVVVEVGVGTGASLAFWGRCAAPGARLVGVDLRQDASGWCKGRDGRPYGLPRRLPAGARMVLLPGDTSASPLRTTTVLDAVGLPPAGLTTEVHSPDGVPENLWRPVDLLILDGSTDPYSVASDIRNYLPTLRPGGLLALHNIAPSVVPTRRGRRGSEELWAGTERWPTLYGRRGAAPHDWLSRYCGVDRRAEVVRPNSGHGYGLAWVI